MYKKILLVCVSIITIQSARAQTEKGSQLVGAGFGISTVNSNSKYLDPNTNIYGGDNNNKFRSYSFSPNYSYFIADKLDIGVRVGYTYNTNTNDNELHFPQKSSSKAFEGSVYLRKYFLFDNKIGIRTGPYFSYGNSKQTDVQAGYSTRFNNYSNYTGGIGMDFVYFPVKRLALSAILGSIDYSHQTSSKSTEGSSNRFGLGLTNGLILSVNYVFGK